MEKKSLFIFPFLLVSIFFLTSLVSAAPPVCDWRGYAVINNSLANASHVITSYTNNSQATNGTIASSGYYILHVPGNDGDNVTFKICGVYVNESYRTWTCGGVGYNTLNLSINTSANGVACTSGCGCSGGYCVHSICRSASTYCGDGYCDSGESCTADCGGGGGEVTGGGGGAAGVGTTTTTTTAAAPVIETGVIQNISAGQTANVTVNKSDDLKIQEISIETKNNVNNVQITIKETTQPSTANIVISTDQGAVYKYLEITKANIQDADINKVKIKFKVEKSWLTSNNMDKNSVALNRLVGTSWTKLPTTIVSEDSTYVYYEAESPGLSIFAITGQKAVAPTKTTTTSAVTTTTTAAPPQLPAIPTLYIAVVFIVVIILVVLYFMRKNVKFTKVVSKE